MVLAGAYTSVDDARADFEGIKEIHKEAWLGPYEGVLFTKGPTARSRSWTGTRASVRPGPVPASRRSGHRLDLPADDHCWGGSGRHGRRSPRPLLRDLQAQGRRRAGRAAGRGRGGGIVMIGVPTPELGAQKLLKRAAKDAKKQVDADAERDQEGHRRGRQDQLAQRDLVGVVGGPKQRRLAALLPRQGRRLMARALRWPNGIGEDQRWP